VAGMHAALVVAAVALAIGALTAAIFVRSGQPQEAVAFQSAAPADGELTGRESAEL
jgi:hypothetical protein